MVHHGPSSVTRYSLTVLSLTPGSAGGVLFFFNGHDFFHAALMAASGKRRGQPFINNAKSLVRGEDASAQRKNVGVVMLATHLGLIFSADIGGADSVDLIGCNRHANAAAAHQNSQISALLAHIMRHGSGIVRIVNGFG